MKNAIKNLNLALFVTMMASNAFANNSLNQYEHLSNAFRTNLPEQTVQFEWYSQRINPNSPELSVVLYCEKENPNYNSCITDYAAARQCANKQIDEVNKLLAVRPGHFDMLATLEIDIANESNVKKIGANLRPDVILTVGNRECNVYTAKELVSSDWFRASMRDALQVGTEVLINATAASAAARNQNNSPAQAGPGNWPGRFEPTGGMQW